MDRPNRQRRRRRGKSDPTDAEAAARAVLAGDADHRPEGHDRDGRIGPDLASDPPVRGQSEDPGREPDQRRDPHRTRTTAPSSGISTPRNGSSSAPPGDPARSPIRYPPRDAASTTSLAGGRRSMSRSKPSTPTSTTARRLVPPADRRIRCRHRGRRQARDRRGEDPDRRRTTLRSPRLWHEPRRSILRKTRRIDSIVGEPTANNALHTVGSSSADLPRNPGLHRKRRVRRQDRPRDLAVPQTSSRPQFHRHLIHDLATS